MDTVNAVLRCLLSHFWYHLAEKNAWILVCGQLKVFRGAGCSPHIQLKCSNSLANQQVADLPGKILKSTNTF